MKGSKRSRLLSASVLGGGCLLLLLAGSAFARQTFNGGSCVPSAWAAVPNIVSLYSGMLNGSTAAVAVVDLFCATPVTSIGTTNPNWEVVVTDNKTTSGIDCGGFVADSSGLLISSTPRQSTTAAFTGTNTLFLNLTSGGFSSTQTYLVDCTLNGQSYIHSVSLL